MQRPKKSRVLITLISTVIGILGILMNYFGFLPLLRLENYTKDLRAVFGRKALVANDIVLLTIDNASLRLDGLMDGEIQSETVFTQMQAGWPWPRSVYAALLEKLAHAGARVVAFDLLFPSPGPGDGEFSATLKTYRDQAVIGGTFDGIDDYLPSFNRPSESLLEPGRDDRMIGFANFVPDSDGVVRAALFHASPEYFSKRKRPENSTIFNSLAATILQRVSPETKLPAEQNQPFRYGGPPGTYTHYPLYQVFLPSFWQRNFKNGTFFKDKIVVVGPEGRWSHDEHPTPFGVTLNGGMMSGPELHLHALSAARSNDFIFWPGAMLAAGIIAAAAAGGILLNRFLQMPGIRIGASLCVATGYWFCAQFVFNHQGMLLPVAAPLTVLPLIVFAGILVDFAGERFERLRIRATLERYVSSHVAKEILDSPQSYLTSLVGVRKEVSVLFADLRNFTAMVNSLDAGKLVAQLNEYYERVIEDVFQHSGTLDKIMGDGMMAVWGNLRSDGVKQDAVNAVRTALAIQISLAELNVKWAAQGRPKLAIGIGIACGECVVGNVGSERKMDLTVIGDAANLAARLQGLTRESDHAVFVSSEIAARVRGEFSVPAVTTLNIRGLEKPETVHSVQSFATTGLFLSEERAIVAD